MPVKESKSDDVREKKKKKAKCPHGHDYAFDVDDFGDCEDCEVKTACAAAYDNLED